MPVLCEFDTRSVHPPENPFADTQGTVHFPQTFVARPRLPHGLRELNMSRNANISVKSTNMYYTTEWADCHITTWDDAALYSGIDSIFVLTPADVEFQTGEHMRTPMIDPNDPPSARVDFREPFASPPKVVVFFNYLDLDKHHGWRIKTTATDIDERGFTIKIETWGNTILNAAQACWIAYPEDRKHIFSTSINTLEVRPTNKKQHQHNKTISFDGVEFWKEPDVFVALNYLDVSRRANLRINAYVDGVTSTNLNWHVDSWDDTVLHAGGASIIAFNR
ncbi:hypothetical protein CPB83DRAFT_882899 [Crepidotus variabilis]|uniref:H-type lectin domain-containing protein n=1 Tax=Crepidotus variabilis TaxID=179855 RepID=A0A9P6EH22_9AGAR|nr:hypothetical protein CPB83DRAFT_882899 [Crepidotus variabilis]